MMLERFPEISRLSKPEKLALATELWDELDEDPIEVSPEIVAELDKRMAELEANPGAVTTWEAIKRNLRSVKK
jgi:putative addiction module component (TIGR02574 family)